jgi:putative oxidoreductase
MQFMNQQYGIPTVFAFLAIVAQFFGSIGLIVGLLGRVAALGITITMIVAAVHVHLPYGFFINWGGTQQGEGIEFQVLALGMGIALVIKGSGALSLDNLLTVTRESIR